MITKNSLFSILLFALNFVCANTHLSWTQITYNQCSPEVLRSSTRLTAIITSLIEQIDPHAYHNKPVVTLNDQGYVLLQALTKGGYIALNVFNDTNTVYLNTALLSQKPNKLILNNIQQQLGASSHQTQQI